MFAKNNHLLPILFCLCLASISRTQIVAPLVRQPPPDQLGIQGVPKNALREDRPPAISRNDKKLVEPAAEDVEKFGILLRKTNYGIAKLLNSDGSSDEQNEKVVDATDLRANSIP